MQLAHIVVSTGKIGGGFRISHADVFTPVQQFSSRCVIAIPQAEFTARNRDANAVRFGEYVFPWKIGHPRGGFGLSVHDDESQSFVPADGCEF